jgi:predicted regulator of Ras-like GTPase activity (Roadblock/LC7/MglB family)
MPEKLLENLINYNGIDAAIVITKDGINHMGKVDEEYSEMVTAISSTIFGSSEQLENLLDDELECVIVKGKNSKVILYNIGELIISISGDINHDEIENEIIEDVSNVSHSITRAGFPDKNKNSTINDMIDRIEKYNSARGQENVMREILNDIPNNSSSLGLLKELKREVSGNLDRMVVNKMVEIIHSEQQKAILEAN